MRPEFGDGRPSGTVAEYFAVSPQRFSLRSDKLQISIVLSYSYKNNATLTRDEYCGSRILHFRIEPSPSTRSALLALLLRSSNDYLRV